MFFKCKHPFVALAVEKEHTIVAMDDDFTGIDYHLLCRLCNKVLVIKHAKLNKPVAEFLNIDAT